MVLNVCLLGERAALAAFSASYPAMQWAVAIGGRPSLRSLRLPTPYRQLSPADSRRRSDAVRQGQAQDTN